MPRIQDCLSHGWENPINEISERRYLDRRDELESEEEDGVQDRDGKD